MKIARKWLLKVGAVLVAVTVLLLPATLVASPRIKDIVDIENVRPNQLIGYGLVVGLAGTGDKIRNAPFTEESMQAMLERMGVTDTSQDLTLPLAVGAAPVNCAA